MTDRKEQLIDILTQTGRMEEADEYAEIARQEEREKVLELIGEWIPNLNGEINSYTEGRKDERIAIRNKLRR